MSVFFTRRGKAGARVKYVKSIISDGNCYVDTEYKPNQNTRVVADIRVVRLSGYAPLFGARIASRNNEFATWAIGETSYQDGFGTSMTAGLAATTTNRNTVDKNKNRFIVNGTTLTTHAAATFQSALNLYIFNINTNGSLTGSYKTYAELFSFQIYENDRLVRDFWPCYDPDGVLCLYDKVEGTYYYNKGTGSFSTEESGGEDAVLIAFTIAGTSYAAEEGMTWAQWVASSYNTNGYYVTGTYIRSSQGQDVYYGGFVKATDTIVANRSYTHAV